MVWLQCDALESTVSLLGNEILKNNITSFKKIEARSKSSVCTAALLRHGETKPCTNEQEKIIETIKTRRAETNRAHDLQQHSNPPVQPSKVESSC